MRLRCFLFSLVLLLSACADPYASLPPDTAVAAAQESIQDGDPRRALRLLKSAASRGDLTALATLAQAHDRGYLQVQSHREAQTINRPIRRWPREGPRWRRANGAEVERRVAAGDPEGLHAQAARLMERTFRDGQ